MGRSLLYSTVAAAIVAWVPPSHAATPADEPTPATTEAAPAEAQPAEATPAEAAPAEAAPKEPAAPGATVATEAMTPVQAAIAAARAAAAAAQAAAAASAAATAAAAAARAAAAAVSAPGVEVVVDPETAPDTPASAEPATDPAAEPAAEPASDAAPAEEAPAETPSESAEAPVEDETGFEKHGELDVGLRAFLVDPSRSGRAKFEEYGEVPEWVYLNKFYYGLRAKDASFQGDFWIENPGYNNGKYELQLWRPGQAYVSGSWDRVPHLYSTSAFSAFNLTGNQLTVRDGFDEDDLSTYARPEIGVQRDKGKADFKFTPTAGWTLTGSYTHDRKQGTRPLGNNEPRAFASIELIEPISYLTQNYSLGAQYFGKWRGHQHKNWMISAQYQGSTFENEFDALIWENPLGGGPDTNSLPPSNQSHTYGGSFSTDLPFMDARYVGTIAKGYTYTKGRIISDDEDDPFLQNATGAIDTFMHNHLLTAKLHKDVSATARYRYHKVEAKNRLLDDDDLDPIGSGDPILVSPGYERQTASADLKWRVKPTVTVGGRYQWDLYDREFREVKQTEEHLGKVFIDARPTPDMRILMSYLESEATFRGPYNQLQPDQQDPMLRKYDIANRRRSKGTILSELYLSDELTISPTFGYRYDRYSDGDAMTGNLGLKSETVWTGGFEANWVVNERLTIASSYTRETFNREMMNCPVGDCDPPDGSDPQDLDDAWGSSIDDIVHTFNTSATFDLVPSKLDLRIGHIYAFSTSKTDTYALGSSGEISDPQFPEVENSFQRLSAVLSYYFDEEEVKRWRLHGEVTAKLGYVYERNNMKNWQTDFMVPYMVDVVGIGGEEIDENDSLFLAWMNPNYETHYLYFLLNMKW